MLYGGQVQTMMPKIRSTNFDGMELIRPMYLIREKDILHWRDYNKLQFLQCACKFTELTDTQEKNNKELSSKRKKVKKLIADLSKVDKQIENNIFKSTQNVNLSKILEYKDNHGKRHNFLEEYK